MDYQVNEELDIARALSFGWRGSMWRLVDNDYGQLTWLDESKEMPGLEEVIATDKLAIKKEKESLYLLMRLEKYPDIVEQLDMIYWDKVNGTSRWVDMITTIKLNHPKDNVDG